MKTIGIDGSSGEGGGQILRTSLALSVITGRPCVIDAIRAKRRKPGLMRQHLACVRAAREISAADVVGEEIGSTRLEFHPHGVTGGDYHFSIGSAGSTMLVLQTVLLPLLLAESPSEVRLEGGTHNPLAPTFDFIEHAYLPLLTRMGGIAHVTLRRPGFFPAGGGEVQVSIAAGATLVPIDIVDGGEAKRYVGRVTIANLPRSIAEREVVVLRKKLGWGDDIRIVDATGGHGPGNVVSLAIVREYVCEMATSFGAKGAKAEGVARGAVDEIRRYQRAGAAVGLHLADQLLLPLALAGGGSFHAQGVTPHCETNAAVIEQFLPVAIEFDRRDDGTAMITVRRLQVADNRDDGRRETT